ncbi:MAG: type II secretion system GspH family protein [Oscillospiraceae bacterium]|nr:type II secretion system GspH family protein [Oscillospiraceae bacterium]
MNIRKNKENGITLIALIITVIVMLILAGVAVRSIINNGLISKTTQAVSAYNNSVNDEESSISNMITMLDSVGGSGYTPPAPVEPEIKAADLGTDDGNIASSTDSTGVIEIVWLDMNNNVIEKPLAPNLGSGGGLTPVKWDGTTEVPTTANDTNWYNYQAQVGATDGKTSNWANAKTSDGSYWVWVPRYAYKIIYFDNTDHADYYREKGEDSGFDKSWITGYSTIYGMIDKDGNIVQGSVPNINVADRVKTSGYTDYIPHPAFLGTGYENLGGGFGTTSKGISGFWVAKFEMSMEDGNGVNVDTANATMGNVALSSTVKAVSKPGLNSWVYINIANCYENSLNYDASLGHNEYDSHLFKNSEWGAIAYLTHSRYGRNGTNISRNSAAGSDIASDGQAITGITGGGSGTVYATTNGEQSTTGNATGIYDIAGGVYEQIAAFNNAYSGIYYTDSSCLSVSGKTFASTGGVSTKYTTAYSNNTSMSEPTTLNDFFDTGGRHLSNIGDASYETYVSGIVGWFTAYIQFINNDDGINPGTGRPFMVRGGWFYSSSVFSNPFEQENETGAAVYRGGFRIVLSIQ